MVRVNVLDAQTNLSRLVEKIETGAETEIIISRNGIPVARLVGLRDKHSPLRLGLAEGRYPDMDFDEFQSMDAEVADLVLKSDM